MPTYAVTGSTGHLGRLVIADLLARVPSDAIVALARTPSKGADLGVTVRTFDYDRPETLPPALEGVDRLLLISASEVGKRVPQHQAVIDAAKAAGVSLIVYTSVLHAPDSLLGLADEHRQTEAALAESGVPFALLRNGWYTENYTGSIGAAVEHGVVLGSAGDARVTPATRADYAAAAAVVLTADDPAGQTLELAGDEAFTMAEYAAEVARQSGREVAYQDLPEEDYRAALERIGLPGPVAGMIAQSDAAAGQGALYDDGRALSRLIGRPTTPLADAVAAALAA
ncbi:MAG: NAD(P)-dependent oxidoreductase [Rhodothermaceae bacterium]|nr:NAD(P)-dependent oxidoreductase [Rhodothermaceae bacterium]